MMLLNRLRYISPRSIVTYVHTQKKCIAMNTAYYQQKLQETPLPDSVSEQFTTTEVFSARPVPMIINNNNDAVVLSFDEVPGPKSLKYLSVLRQYLNQVGTQLTAGAISLGFSLGSLINNGKALKKFSTFFDEYGPVVRFVSPVGNDVVLINNPDHIKKVFVMEGEFPVRSTLDSLEKYRTDHRNHFYAGLFNLHGEQWTRQRNAVIEPLGKCMSQQICGINEICDSFSDKLYSMRNYQDEVTTDLYQEIHKWAFDCMGLIIFSRRFSMIETDKVYSQCDMSWFYYSLKKATEAINKCESGMQLWKFMPTPAWNNLVKYCDSLENLIGKQVLRAEQTAPRGIENEMGNADNLMKSLINSESGLKTEDVTTIIMDMLLLGVSTISTSMTFMFYYLATYKRIQKALYDEVSKIDLDNMNKNELIKKTPYLQACIKETLRLAPPIPVLTRILPKNIVLDKYNIPSGTLVIMSTQDAALKETNYDDAEKFYPERWLSHDALHYHDFASIPFGFGAKQCMGRNVAETTMTLLTIKLMKRYKMEYHYGYINPTRSFISKPDKPLRIRLIDRGTD